MRVAVPYKVRPYRRRLGDWCWQVEAGQENCEYRASIERVKNRVPQGNEFLINAFDVDSSDRGRRDAGEVLRLK